MKSKLLELKQRQQNLNNLLTMLESYRQEFLEALHKDLDKPYLESMNSEWVLLSEETRYALRHLKTWMKPIRHKSPLIIKPAKAELRAEPLGQVLIIAPWNYPLYLSLAPIIGAMAAGNSIVLKPSEKAPATAALLEKAITAHFPSNILKVVNGSPQVSAQLLEQSWGKVLFTGSNATGHKVYEACARTQTPVVLELGGKNPVYINPSMPLKTALKRIFWGKFFNAGQTCVAPDFLLLPQSQLPEFKTLAPSLLKQMYEHPDSLKQSLHLTWQRDRITQLLKASQAYGDQILCGADWQGEYLNPTLILIKDKNSPLMEHEIFGPILAVLSLSPSTLPETLMPKTPLALYLFSSDPHEIERITQHISSGSVVINGTLSQMTLLDLPFGGVGSSGIGRYKGKAGFETFSHFRPWVIRHPRWELPVVYQPYPKQLHILFGILKYFFRIRF
jgi:aldehyde dehydrogenase (NAD+)